MARSGWPAILPLGNSSIIKLAPSFGGLSTTVIADDPANLTTWGIVDVNNGVKVCGSAGYNTDSTNAIRQTAVI